MYEVLFSFYLFIFMQAQPSVIEVTEGEGPVSVDLVFTAPWTLKYCGGYKKYGEEYCSLDFVITTPGSNDLTISHCNLTFRTNETKTITVKGEQ